jgi:hypothetical protein
MTLQEQVYKVVDTIGESVPKFTRKGLEFIQDQGFVTNNVTAKLLSVLIVLGASYLILHFGQSIKPALKWTIKIVAIILIGSIIFASFIQ